jgi:hypothetical protein
VLLLPPWSTLAKPAQSSSYGQVLSSDHRGNSQEYETNIAKLAKLDTQQSHDGVLLSRTIMALSLYRLLKSSEVAELSQQTFACLVELGWDGLQAAKRLAQQQLPWWHLANVPFQLLCTMLVIDTHSSYVQIQTILRALEDVAHAIPSSSIKQALEFARVLVEQSRKYKTQQLQYLDKCPVPPYEHTASAQDELSQSEEAQTRPLEGGLPFYWETFDMEAVENASSLDWSLWANVDIPIFDATTCKVCTICWVVTAKWACTTWWMQ